jgi:hypothetical protein
VFFNKKARFLSKNENGKIAHVFCFFALFEFLDKSVFGVKTSFFM